MDNDLTNIEANIMQCNNQQEHRNIFEKQNETNKLILGDKHLKICQTQCNKKLNSNKNSTNDNSQVIAFDNTSNQYHTNIKQVEKTQSQRFSKKTTSTLNAFSVKELQLLVVDLAQTVNEVSNKLVSLLQENDTLQQESDARNIAIEQLLKLTVKQSEIELRPVKLSVISSDDTSGNEEEEWD